MSWQQRGAVYLTVLTLLNLLNYMDRFILAALAPAFQPELGISDIQVGLLGSAFMVVYFVISPLFGWIGDRGHRMRWMGFGAMVWSFATIASGWSRTFSQLLSARVLVGVGEASYASISPALISDLYPKTRRGRAFALFFMAIPVGSALGYLLGGFIEQHFGWRNAFFFAGIPGLLLGLGLCCFPDPKRGAFESENLQERPPLLKLCVQLWRNHAYRYTVLGYIAYTFVVGGVAYWMPAFCVRFLNLELGKANMLFGGVTVVAGFLGTIAGGYWADRWALKSSDAYLKLSALSAFLAAAFFALALITPTVPMFLAWVFVMEFFLFLSTSPVNAQIVNCVPVSYRATANAVSIFAIHLLGDAISPTLIGAISQFSDLRWGLAIGPGVLAGAGAFWLAKMIFAWEPLPWPQAWRLPRVQCHRGYEAGGVQENTLEAFRAAKRAGAEMIELDVQLAADGVPVVVHDLDLMRVSGYRNRIRETSATELWRLARVPSLESVLRDPDVPRLINVEIKSTSSQDIGLERAVASVVEESQATERVIFSSFNPLALRRLSQILPEVPRALLVTNKFSKENKIYLRKMWLAFLARPHMVNLDLEMYDVELAQRLRERNIPVALWTVSEEDLAKKFLAEGVESIISPLARLSDA